MDHPSDFGKLHKMEKASLELAKVLDAVVTQHAGGEKKWGFALLIFDFGDSGEMTWISNANRPEMIEALKELIAKFEAGTEDEHDRKKRWNARQN